MIDRSKAKVWIAAPTRWQFSLIAKKLSASGYDVGSVYLRPSALGDARETDPARLSNDQIRRMADQTIDGLLHADILISVHSRDEPSDRRGSAYWAGFARARGIPTLLVGAFDDVGLYATGSEHVSMDVDDVLAAVEKMNRRRTNLMVLDAPFDMMASVAQGVADARLQQAGWGKIDGNDSAARVDGVGAQGSSDSDRQGGARSVPTGTDDLHGDGAGI